MGARQEQPNPTLVVTSLYCTKMSLLWRLNDKYQIHMSLMLMIIMMCRNFPQINMRIQHTIEKK